MTIHSRLEDIAVKYPTDKHGLHGYCSFYHDLLTPYRNLPINLLEIGVDGGGSLLMWNEFFTNPDTRIYGVEIQDHRYTMPERVKVFNCDATSPNFIHDLITETGGLHIIIEDASHYSKDQKQHLEQMWQHVKSGGLFITEDTHTSYHYPWTDQGEVSYVTYLLDWIHRLNENGANHCGKSSCELEEMIFRKSLVVLKKR